MTALELRLDQPPRIAAASAVGVCGEHGPETYRLPRLWCLNLYRGEGVLELRGGRYPFRTGCASITPPDTDYRFEFAGRTLKTWVHFAPCAAGALQRVPVMQDLGADFVALREAVVEASVCRQGEPQRATARVWDVLWRLVRPQRGPGGEHPILRRAREHIEEFLTYPLSPEGIARRCRCSATHLNRLMRAAEGIPLMEYVRKRRVERAVHLLRQSTLPVGRIGELVGIPDQHQFNKTVRRLLGRPPRAVRAGR